jgi:hypothetical protein
MKSEMTDGHIYQWIKESKDQRIKGSKDQRTLMKMNERWGIPEMIERVRKCADFFGSDQEQHKKQKMITQYDHIDLIVGRGRVSLNGPGHMNIPLNPMFRTGVRNHLLIDSDPWTQADIRDLLENIDFDQILMEQGPGLKIIKFIFDWSTFYCSAIYSMVKIAHKLKYDFEILVPLDPGEQRIPCEITDVMNDPIFVTTVQHGFYPLFDPDPLNKNSDQTKSAINTEKYIMISVIHNK